MKPEASDKAVSWLLRPDQPAARYHALVDLLDEPAGHPDVEQARSEIPKRGWAFEILKKQKPDGRWETKESLYRPKYTATNWMSLILSDLGLTREEPRIERAAGLFFKEWMSGEENIFKEEICVVGNTARMLTRFGYGDDPKVKKLFDRLLEDQKEDGGWHCWASDKGTLDCWEALAAFAAVQPSKRTRRMKAAIERGAEFYLQRRLIDEGRPRYLPWFRLHYPVHYYYDVLVGLDTITALGCGGDSRLKPALEILSKKRRGDGTWPLERVHPDPPSYAWGKGNLRWKAIPFALEAKGAPSKWITFTALRVYKRVDAAGQH